jgi:serine/threonine protein kinase
LRSSTRACSWLLDGLLFLHSKNVLHGAVQAANILVGEDTRAKLCGFGLCWPKTDMRGTLTAQLSAVERDLMWCAPECIDDPGHYSERSEVFSAAMTVELVTFRLPFGESCGREDIKRRCARRRRCFNGSHHCRIASGLTSDMIEPTDEFAPPLLDAILKCWAVHPRQRPSLAVAHSAQNK